MTFAGRASDEHRANAVSCQKRCLKGNNLGRNATVSVEGRMNGGDEMMKRRNRIVLPDDDL
jgi:hypothetical protein